MVMKQKCKWESRWIWSMLCFTKGSGTLNQEQKGWYLVVVNKGVGMDVLLNVCREIQPQIQ